MQVLQKAVSPEACFYSIDAGLTITFILSKKSLKNNPFSRPAAPKKLSLGKSSVLKKGFLSISAGF
ncbi:hypothetical protein A0O21_08305 [Streptococcus pantholopis]|uniref:Uncharacterized protein n=1 Tax=Streptococcus pantholopis TaxID=1811193 RepID=A0A172Q924_9STRE|nr:hypothetical protein A0O21_08305 [Streptococcus pantholopis]